MKFFLLIIASIFTWQALAMEEPNELIKKSKIGAVELQDVIFSIEQNIPQMTDATLFRNYLRILPELESEAKINGLEMIYPEAVQELGTKMVAHGMRWLDLRFDEASVIDDHLRWMNAASVYRFLYLVETQMNELQDPQTNRFCDNLQLLIQYSSNRYKNEPYITSGYRDLLSQVAYKKIKEIRGLDFLLIAPWIPHLQNQEVLSNLVNYLSSQSLTFTVEDEKQARQLLLITQALSAQLSKVELSISDSTREAWGQIVVEVSDQMLIHGWSLEEPLLTSLLDRASLNNLIQLADRWSLPSRQANNKNVKAYLILAEYLSDRLEIQGAYQKAEDFRNTIEERSVHAVIQLQNLEGTYLLEDPKSKKQWRFTVVRATDASYIVGLGQLGGSGQIQSYKHIEYNLDKNSFYATQEKAGEINLNLFLEFFVLNGEMMVHVPLLAESRLTGKKIETYEDFFDCCNENQPSLKGNYTGTMTLEGKTQTAKLTLFDLNGQTIGRLQLDKYVEVDLQAGSLSKKGFIYLTTQRPRGGTEYHIRLKLTSAGDLEGFAILSGYGIKQRFHLSKIGRP